jgi:hypothetical protein
VASSVPGPTGPTGAAGATGAVGPTGPTGSTTAPNRAMGLASSLTLSASPQIAALVNVTPTITGKYTVWVTGIVDNADSGQIAHPVVLSVSHGSGVTTADFTQPTYTAIAPGGAVLTTFPLACVVAIDKVPATVVLAVGTPTTINVVLTGDASGKLTIPANGVQIFALEAVA